MIDLKRSGTGRTRQVSSAFSRGMVCPHLRLEAALEVFRSGEVSLLRGAEIAGTDFIAFRRLLRDRGIREKVEAETAAQMNLAVDSFFAGQLR